MRLQLLVVGYGPQSMSVFSASFRRHWPWCAAYILIVVAATLAIGVVSPRLSDPTYTFPDGKTQVIPFLDTQIRTQGTVTIRQTMRLGWLHPTQYRIAARECLQETRVNGWSLRLPEEARHRCDYGRGVLLDLRENVHRGQNTLIFRAENRRDLPLVVVSPDIYDPLILIIVFAALALGVTTFYFHQRQAPLARDPWLAGAFFLGVTARVLYVIQTPLLVRGHDTEGHVEYLAYMLDTWRIPDVALGWQTYQPPLYYWLMSALLWPVHTAFGSWPITLFNMRLVAIVPGMIVLYLAYRLALLLFPQVNQRWSRVAFLALAALLPRLTIVSSTLNNDALASVWYFLFAWRAMQFWQKPTQEHWWWCVGVTVVALLTKSNTLILVPVMLTMGLTVSKWSWRRRWHGLLQAIGAIALGVGWYYVFRFYFQDQVHLIGNIRGNNPLLFTRDWQPWYLLTFKPLRLLMTPYYLPFSDEGNRMYFFHVLLTSAYSGEWKFAPTVLWILRVIHVTNFILLPLGLATALLHCLKRLWSHLPLMLCFVSMIAAMMALQWTKNNGGLQDFRYATILFVPVAYFVLRGIELVSPRWRKVFRIVCVLQIVALIVFYPVMLWTA